MGAVLERGPQTQCQDMTGALRARATEDTSSVSAWSPSGSLETRQTHLDTWAHHTSQTELSRVVLTLYLPHPPAQGF